jgi:hypothetical protein
MNDADQPLMFRTRQQSRAPVALTVFFLFLVLVSASSGLDRHDPGATVAGKIVTAVVLVAIAAVIAIVGIRAARTGVLADSDGITIRNLRRSIRVRSDEIDRFSIEPALWGSIGYAQLRDRTSVPIWGIQGQNRALFPNSRWATSPIDGLNKLLDEHQRSFTHPV